MHRDPLGRRQRVARAAEAKGLSIRELIIEVTGRQNFIGSGGDGRRRRSTTSCSPTPPTASSSSRTSRPGGLDPFVDQVVPLLQERGVFRTEYQGTTLRDHLGLRPLDGAA